MGTSIGKVGFLGERYQKLWCLTHIETLRYYLFPLTAIEDVIVKILLD